jgi:hypothetical protein
MPRFPSNFLNRIELPSVAVHDTVSSSAAPMHWCVTLPSVPIRGAVYSLVFSVNFYVHCPFSIKSNIARTDLSNEYARQYSQKIR